jgi:diaminohydroxyphosphoribosylaminopyrimidine deaminase/5-amino-6-(5-phosphoribosylamino)uracil reductase
MTANDIYFMRRCLELAKKGIAAVAPNPLVGCVIVCEGKIVSEGYHEKYGSAHAEPNAISKVDDSVLKLSTLYVNLEPCCHFGKTGPCADLIISKSIAKVVIGNMDPNPLVAGKGIQKLKDAGIEVEYGILEEECRELNIRFFTFHQKKRPYVIFKWAQTQNGFISQWPLPENKEDNWITGLDSKRLVHRWRSEEQAILIGYNTLLADDPHLTVRLVDGKNPLRMVMSRNCDFPPGLNVFNHEAGTLVFTAMQNQLLKGIACITIDWNQKVKSIMDYCFENQISSLIVEGGTNTIYNFMNANTWDEARVFVNPDKRFEHGVIAPEINLNTSKPIKVGEDLLYTVLNT